MDILLHCKAAIMGVVEGLTEFLPISSTGHLILAGRLLGFNIPQKETFIIAIQAAAILAVCWQYRSRLWHLACGIFYQRQEQIFLGHLLLAFLPAAFLGITVKDLIEKFFFNPIGVASAFIIGGIIMLVVEKRLQPQSANRIESIDDMSWHQSLKIGLAQCCALIPGVSRSGATIIGGLIFGLSRPAATIFSFFLALPTITGASVWSLWTARHSLSIQNISLYLTASITSFITALFVIRWLLKYISTHDFKIFAWYRIVFGCAILASSLTSLHTLWP